MVLHAGRVRSLGFFSELEYLQGDDDRDISLRARLQRGWYTGYVLVDVRYALCLSNPAAPMRTLARLLPRRVRAQRS